MTTLQTMLRLSLGASPEFTLGGWGQRVKAAGGHYSHCRGASVCRDVHLPLDVDAALVIDLVERFPILRDRRREVRMTVAATCPSIRLTLADPDAFRVRFVLESVREQVAAYERNEAEKKAAAEARRRAERPGLLREWIARAEADIAEWREELARIEGREETTT